MFYSETLLSKTGPLARVWLSANLERKLSKTNILQTNIQTSVGAIVGQDQAPMALRLSGQLLLGVVRIYSRKARYLYEDCSEALVKIKMAFRPGNVDLQTGTTAHSAAQLTLPDVITELDLLMPDPSSLLADLGDLNLDGGSQPISRRRDIMIDDSTFLNESQIETGRAADSRLDMEDSVLQLEDDLGLDIGEPLQVEDKRPLRVKERNLLEEDDDISIEMGRDRPPSRGISEDFTRDDFQLDVTMSGATPKARPQDKSEQPLQLDEDLNLGGDDDFGANQSLDWQAGIGEEISAILGPHEQDINAASLGLECLEGLRIPDHGDGNGKNRDSMSPLSSVRSSVERELEAEIRPKGTGVLDMTFVDDAREGSKEPEEVVVAAKPSAPRKRFLVEDTVTEIKAKQIKAQQEDRSSILKEPSFLPRDAGVLALVTMQRTGGFASSVFYPKNIHPDLAGLLSPEFVKRMAAAKRKREEEQTAEGEDGTGKESPAKRIQLDLGDDSMFNEGIVAAEAAAAEAKQRDDDDDDHQGDDSGELLDFGGRDVQMVDDDTFMLAGDETLRPGERAGSHVIDGAGVNGTSFHGESDILPGIHEPVSTGPLSQQTIAAVHLLRSEFSAAADVTSSPSGTQQRRHSAALNREQRKFQDLLPPATTSRVDATKMFFEVLVLATKDAVKVKQEKGFGGDILIAPKKGLWGKWAEEKDEQQIAEEEQTRKEAEESKAAEEQKKRRAADIPIRNARVEV
ncbi:Rec8 like protein-domain-containing protein [Terfezia claveryi]|nr:Rec8 like protein-domain-containing protein [Terfezia claveryi]